MSETNNYNFHNCGRHGYNIPVLRLLKGPVTYVEDLYLKYPNGGEYGWYAFVSSKNMFHYWDINSKTWEPMQSENLEDILPIDKGSLQVGDVPVWDGTKFTTVNLSLFATENY